MANMEYCRFRNTRSDVVDCLEVLRDEKSLSEEEYVACKRMFEDFVDFLIEEGVVEDEDGELEDRLTEFFDRINVEE